jgi:sigma-E factor negative regulatory protein RseB
MLRACSVGAPALLAWVLGCTLSAAHAQPREQALDTAKATQWLTRMHNAARQANYQGTLVVSRGGQMMSSRVAHFCEGPQSFERVDALDGQSRHVLRHNDQVLTVWPAQRAATLEQRQPGSTAAGPQGVDARLLAHYDVFAEGPSRVAGHEASVLLLRPRDSWRFAQRLWLEQAGGLVLRSDVMASDGRVLESTAFSDVALAVKPQPQQITAPMKRLDGLRVVRTASSRTALEAEGWRLKSLVPGFQSVSCVRRTWHVEPAVADPAGYPVLQAIYSDGLTHVSLFLEPQRADRQRPTGIMATGATHTLMTLVSAHEVTVIGDVPPATLKEFANALERLR